MPNTFLAAGLMIIDHSPSSERIICVYVHRHTHKESLSPSLSETGNPSVQLQTRLASGDKRDNQTDNVFICLSVFFRFFCF